MTVADPDLAIRINQVLSRVRAVLEAHLESDPEPLTAEEGAALIVDLVAQRVITPTLAAVACRYVLDVLDAPPEDA